MTDLFVTAYTYSIMEHINTDDTYFLYRSTCFDIAKFYESLMEFARLEFILEDNPAVRTVYSIDFTRDYYLFRPNYKENFGLMVEFNADKSYNETLIIANKTSEVVSLSECFLDNLQSIELNKLALQMMAAEDVFNVVRLLSMKQILLVMIRESIYFCKPKNTVDGVFEIMFMQPKVKNQEEMKETAKKMNCFRKFITEETVNGVTFFRVNIKLQPGDKDCEYLNNHILDVENTDSAEPVEACARKKAKEGNYTNRKWELNLLGELGIAEQQKEEAKMQLTQFMVDSRMFYFDCQMETFNRT